MFAHLAQYQSPWWQSVLNDPIQVALENRSVSWGEFAIEEALPAGWTAYPDVIQEKEEDVMDNFLEPQRCVRFADDQQQQQQQSMKTTFVEEEDDSFTVVKSAKSVKPVANPAKIKTVVVRNLPRNTTTELMSKRFAKYGEIADVYLPKNQDASKGPVGSIKGFAMIRFTNPLASAMAIATEKARGEQIEFAKADRV
jgi:RNA recognition motif-containing protein